MNVARTEPDDPEVEQVSGRASGVASESAHLRAHQKFRQPSSSPHVPGEGPVCRMITLGLFGVVTIQNIDSNMCCGTHVSNLSDLQVGEKGLLNGWERGCQGVGDHSRAGSDGGDTRRGPE